MTFRQGSIKYWARKPHKYNAVKTECLSGRWHRSGLEARVCDELRLRKIAGEIKDYDHEKVVRLKVDGLFLGSIIPDFLVYNNDGTREFVEAKGMELGDWKKKWRYLQHMFKDDPTVTFRVVKK